MRRQWVVLFGLKWKSQWQLGTTSNHSDRARSCEFLGWELKLLAVSFISFLSLLYSGYCFYFTSCWFAPLCYSFIVLWYSLDDGIIIGEFLDIEEFPDVQHHFRCLRKILIFRAVFGVCRNFGYLDSILMLEEFLEIFLMFLIFEESIDFWSTFWYLKHFVIFEASLDVRNFSW